MSVPPLGTIVGTVVPGDGRGRELGFPTANVEVPSFICLPADGVYAGWLRGVGGDAAPQQWPAAISVGTNPTFDDVPQRVVEAYALGETALDLYDQTVAVDFVQKVRNMQAFASADVLVEAMHADVQQVERILGLS